MDEWLIVLAALLVFYWKHETKQDASRDKEVKDEILKIVESQYRSQIESLESELQVITGKLDNSQELKELKEISLAAIQKELDSIRDFIKSTNEKSDTLAQDIKDFQDRFGDIFIQLNQENDFDEESFLRIQEDKEELLKSVTDVEEQLNVRMSDYKTLKMKYDDAIFRTLESKAKRVRISEELAKEQHYNQALNLNIQTLSNNIKFLQNEYIPHFKKLEADFINKWEKSKEKYMKEVKYLSDNLMDDLAKYEMLDLNKFKHPKHVKSLIDKLDLYGKNTVPEINKRLKIFEQLVSEIDNNFLEIQQRVMHILKNELKLPDDILAPNMGGNSLNEFLNNDLCKDLDIRHIQSIIFDQNASIIDPNERIGHQENPLHEERNSLPTIRFSYPPKSSSDDEIDSSFSSEDTNISSISSGDHTLMSAAQLEESSSKDYDSKNIIVTDSSISSDLSYEGIVIEDEPQDDSFTINSKTLHAEV